MTLIGKLESKSTGWRNLLSCGLLVLGLGGLAVGADQPVESESPPLVVVVMDPMAAPLSCACVKGRGQRDYDKLSDYLAGELNRPVQVTYAESLALAQRRLKRPMDLIIGKESVVRFDASEAEWPLTLIARLTDPDGALEVRGVVVVRETDAAQKLSDLAGRKLTLGPVEDEETHRLVHELLLSSGLEHRLQLSTADSLDAAAYSVLDAEADAAVLPDYMPEFLAACGKMGPDELRVLATTSTVGFVGVFATHNLNRQDQSAVSAALKGLSRFPKLLVQLETKRGFVDPNELRSSPKVESEWNDWRGPGRRGLSDSIPWTLPASLNVLWEADVTGPAMAGIAATKRFVVVADKDADLKHDVFRCFDARSGRPLWSLRYRSERKVDYTNAPRATPVIVGDRVYLQGVWGELHCVRLATGEVVWKKNLLTDLDGQVLTWGFSVPPLVVGNRLIVAPGGRETSLVALDAGTGEVLWKSPGHAAAYAPFIVATLGGRKQIVGYDVAGLGGWDLRTGQRLWEMIPPGRADFHVATPIVWEGKILLATENNATRLYRFQPNGQIDPEPIEFNDDLAPDTCTPVVVNRRLFATAFGELYCLDIDAGLKTLWARLDDHYYDHTNLIGGNDRVLIWNTSGDLILIRADVDEHSVVAKLRPFAGDVESMSHPAIVGNRLYLRTETVLKCLELPAAPVSSDVPTNSSNSP